MSRLLQAPCVRLHPALFWLLLWSIAFAYPP
jgi:hypothetical protein